MYYNIILYSITSSTTAPNIQIFVVRLVKVLYTCLSQISHVTFKDQAHIHTPS